jgi:hypothetical protein
MIGLTIAKLLKQDSALLALVPTGNIFPYVANENTQLPLITYTVDSITSGYMKDGWTGDVVTFSVISYSENYASLQGIAKEVREALHMKTDSGTGRIETSGFQEGFNISENVFMNKLSFTVKINSY